jgi:hypothetical protein
MVILMKRSSTLQDPSVNQMRDDSVDTHGMRMMTKTVAGRGFTLEDSSTKCQDAWILGEEAETVIRSEVATEAGRGGTF